MDAKYQKYYNGLKGKDFASYVSKYKSSLEESKNKLSSVQSTISSSSWSEKGIKIIKETVLPTLISEEANIENAIGILSTAVSKVGNLVDKLKSLDEASNRYSNCSEEEKEKKESYRSEVNKLEKEVDGIISEINGLSLDIQAVSISYGTAINTLTELNSIAALREEFIGDVNDTSKYYDNKAYRLKARPLVCFDNTTGQVYKEGDTIYMKPGEKRVLTVRLPNDSGIIKRIIRTTADGNSKYRSKQYVTAVSDVNPDPNKVDYVNYKSWSNHWPSNVDLHTNYYDWIVTATNEGEVQISQTCEFENTTGSVPKCMVDLNVVVRS